MSRVTVRSIVALCIAVAPGIAHAEQVPLPDDRRLPAPGAARDHPMLGSLPRDGHRLVDFAPVWKADLDRLLASLGL